MAVEVLCPSATCRKTRISTRCGNVSNASDKIVIIDPIEAKRMSFFRHRNLTEPKAPLDDSSKTSRSLKGILLALPWSRDENQQSCSCDGRQQSNKTVQDEMMI